MLPVPASRSLPNIQLIHRPGDASVSALRRPPLKIRKRVLVVDDEIPIVKLVTRILAIDNYEITSAGSGDDAARLQARDVVLREAEHLAQHLRGVLAGERRRRRHRR